MAKRLRKLAREGVGSGAAEQGMPGDWAELLAAALAPLRGRLADAFIFGSVAKGTEKSDSDIDVALVGDSDVNLFEIWPRQRGRACSWAGGSCELLRPQEWEKIDDRLIDVIRRRPQIPLLELMDGQAEQPDNAWRGGVRCVGAGARRH